MLDDELRTFRKQVVGLLRTGFSQEDRAILRPFLQLAARMPHFSWRNLALIQAQRPTATKLATYHEWLAKNVKVIRGERALYVAQFSRGSFEVMPLFDIAQTNAPVEERPLPAAAPLASAVFERVKDHPAAQGIEDHSLRNGISRLVAYMLIYRSSAVSAEDLLRGCCMLVSRDIETNMPLLLDTYKKVVTGLSARNPPKHVVTASEGWADAVPR